MLLNKLFYNWAVGTETIAGARMLTSSNDVRHRDTAIEPDVVSVPSEETPFRFKIRIIAERKQDFWQAFTR